MDVLCEGYLEKCLNPDEAKREWRKRYFVLKRALGSGTQTLEYFKDKEWKKQEPKGVLTLFSGYAAYKVFDPKKKLTFEVKTMDSFFVLSAVTDEAREKWIEALQQNSCVRSYGVTIEETPKSLEMGLKNNEPCMLQITASTVVLMLESSVPISWPFNCIRRYKCHPGSFLIEVGRKAATGEGVFRFFTQEGQDIFEFLGKSVAGRMSTKQEVKPDLISSFVALSTTSSDTQNTAVNIPTSKQNPFMDVTGAGVGGGDGVRFFMKKRSTSSPPPSPTEVSRSPPVIEDSIGSSYSHLKFGQDKQIAPQDSADYDQLARAKQCSRFSKSRMSESNKSPGPSSSKALKVLGLIRSNSAENLQRADSVSASTDSNDMYSHLQYDRQNPKKSQSASNIIGDFPTGQQTSELSSVHHNLSRSEDDGLYNKLHSDLGKKISAFQQDNTYNVLKKAVSVDSGTTQNEMDGTYDKLATTQGNALHRGNRPEPILITDDTYDALSFASDQGSSDPVKKTAVPNNYDVPSNSHDSITGSRPPEETPRSNIGSKAFPTKPIPPVGAKPAIGKKPMPVKPPRKPVPGDVNQNTETPKDTAQVAGKVGGNDFRDNLISQLKKNFESQDQPKSPGSPLSPPNSAKKFVEPFYAVSPFAGGNKPQPVLPSEYDVPTNNAQRFPAPSQQDNKQPMGFLYAVSPFHSGNQKETVQVDQNLYDTPSNQPNVSSSGFNPTSAYDTPSSRPALNQAANLYETPSQQNFIRNVTPSQLGAKEPLQTPNKNMQFMYAVSPFAGGQRKANPMSLGNSGASPEEAAYCEVSELVDVNRRFPGYDPVGGVLGSGASGQEAIYANPRD